MRTSARHARPCTERVPDKFRLRDAGIGYHASVKAFSAHARNRSVGFTPYDGCFKYVDPATGRLRRAKGITKILRGAFYADYTPVYGPRAKPRPRTRETSRQRLARQMADDRVRGLELGTVVHQELCDWARIADERAWRRDHPTPNMYTVKAIRALNKLRIEPLYGEWPIFAHWGTAGIATGIDIVGASAEYDGRLVLIEIKTGYEGYFKRGSGKMTRTPMKRVDNSPQNQAFLQCLTARAMLENEYGIAGTIGLVMRVHARGVNVYAIPDTFLRRQNTIYRGLRAYVLGPSPRADARGSRKRGRAAPRGRGRGRARGTPKRGRFPALSAKGRGASLPAKCRGASLPGRGRGRARDRFA